MVSLRKSMVAPAGKWFAVARVQDLDSSGPNPVSVGTLDLVLVGGAAGWKAFHGLCPHQGALLSEGEIVDGALVCRNHRWSFDAESGARQGGPQCLKSYPTRVDAEQLWVYLECPVEKEPAKIDKLSSEKTRTIEDLPGPKPLPVVGNLLALKGQARHAVLENWAKEYGPAYRVAFGPQKAVVLTDPKLCLQALRDRPNRFRRFHRIEPLFADVGAAGVFSVEGQTWRSQRRLAMEGLSHRRLKGFYPTLSRVAERLYRRWEKAAETNADIDIQEDLMRFTVDVTTTLAFGEDINSLEGGEHVIQRHLEKIFPALERRMSAPFAYWRHFRLPTDRSLDRSVAAIRDWLFKVIERRRELIAASPDAESKNLLDAMIRARDENGERFSDEVLLGNALTMLLAGEDTTANTLAWAVHELCDNAEATTRLQSELDDVVEGAVPNSPDEAAQLSFAAAVANESMRLRPVAPQLFLECNSDTIIGDLVLEKGTMVVLLLRPLALNEKDYPSPNKFSPKRWIGAKTKPAFVPFGSGPRICPGRSLALLEMRVVFATLYKNFTVERVGDRDEVREVSSFTMGPSGLRVKLRRR